jgi:transcriptional regulator with XRE-family HTH domain
VRIYGAKGLLFSEHHTTILIFMVASAAADAQEAIAMDLAHDISIEASLGHLPGPPLPAGNEKRSLHRIAEARRQQGISVRSAARRMGTSMDQVRRQEDPYCDLPLSDLYRWHEALEVPVVDLLIDSNTPLSEPVMTRARLLRIMKTVRAIKDSASVVSIHRFTTMLEQQLIEIMPELADVAAWHSVGQRRSPLEMGRTAERVFPDSFFTDSLG